jgi:DNA mismatch repair protein MSH5
VVETDADIQTREDSDAMNEVIMAVDMKERGTIGCAYYIARKEKLCLMEDIKMAGLEIVDSLKLYAQPTVVLISTRSEERLEEHLNREARGIARGDEASEFAPKSYSELAESVCKDDIFGSYVLDSLPSSDFNYAAAKNRLINLELNVDEAPKVIFTTPGEQLIGDAAYGQAAQGGTGRKGRLIRLAGWIDLDSKLTAGFRSPIRVSS